MIRRAWQIGAAAAGIFLGAELMAGVPLNAQSALQPTAPTAITPSQLPSANPPISRAQTVVQWDGHLLQITANGERLAQVLSAIVLRTGIHMTGSTPDDRIYGSYGPAPLVDVLSDLVSGLPINMLFVQRSDGKPGDLAFTAREGTATSPNATPQSPFAQQAPQQQPPAPVQSTSSPNAIAPTVVPGGPSTGFTQPGDASAGSNPASPNGVKTPQEIFEQLQRLRANSGNR